MMRHGQCNVDTRVCLWLCYPVGTSVLSSVMWVGVFTWLQFYKGLSTVPATFIVVLKLPCRKTQGRCHRFQCPKEKSEAQEVPQTAKVTTGQQENWGRHQVPCPAPVLLPL